MPEPGPGGPQAAAHGGRIARALWQALALASLGLAGLGVFVPGLPTTEFVLLAAWAAAHGSPRLHRWTLAHRVFGPLLAHWQRGQLPRRAKWSATLAMSVAALVLARTAAPLWAGLAIGCMACVLVWLWCRPEPPVPARPERDGR